MKSNIDLDLLAGLQIKNPGGGLNGTPLCGCPLSEYSGQSVGLATYVYPGARTEVKLLPAWARDFVEAWDKGNGMSGTASTALKVMRTIL